MIECKTLSRMLAVALLTMSASFGQQAAAQQHSTPKPFDPDMESGCKAMELFRPPIIARAPRPTPAVADAPPPP